METPKYRREYKGYRTRGLRRLEFRSQTEARWAQFLEFLKWDWDYEPEPRPGYIPDFMIQHPMTDLESIHTKTVLLEVKADSRMDQLQQYLLKISRSGWNGLVLVVGGRLFWTPEGNVHIGIDKSGNPVQLDQCPHCQRFSIFEKQCGQCFVSFVPAQREVVEPLWSESQNRTRWEPVKAPAVIIPAELLAGEAGQCRLLSKILKRDYIWTGEEDYGFKWDSDSRMWKPVNLFRELSSQIPEILIPEYRDWIQKCLEIPHQDYKLIKRDYERLQDSLDLVGDLDRIRRLVDSLKPDLLREEEQPDRIDTDDGYSISMDSTGRTSRNIRTSRDYCLETLQIERIRKTGKTVFPEIVKRFLGYLVSGYIDQGVNLWVRESRFRDWWVGIAGRNWRGKTLVDNRDEADLVLDLDFDPEMISLQLLQEGIRLYKERGIQDCQIGLDSGLGIVRKLGRRVWKSSRDWLVGKKRIRSDLFYGISRIGKK